MPDYEMIDTEKYAWKRTQFCEIGGMIIPYFMCDANNNNLHNNSKYSHLKLEYLGQGRVYSVNDVIQNGIA